VAGNNNDFIANFALNPKVEEFLTSANIWQSYDIIGVFWLTV